MQTIAEFIIEQELGQSKPEPKTKKEKKIRDKEIKTGKTSDLIKVAYNQIQHEFVLYFYISDMKNVHFYEKKKTFSYDDFQYLVQTERFAFVKPFFKKWQWGQMITNIWFKSLTPTCTGQYRKTAKAVKYIKQFPKGVIQFHNSKWKFRIPYRYIYDDNDDGNYRKMYLANDYIKFMELLKDIFKTAEIDVKTSNYGFEVDIARETDEEPASRDIADIEEARKEIRDGKTIPLQDIIDKNK